MDEQQQQIEDVSKQPVEDSNPPASDFGSEEVVTSSEVDLSDSNATELVSAAGEETSVPVVEESSSIVDELPPSILESEPVVEERRADGERHLSKKALLEGLIFATAHPMQIQNMCDLLEINEEEAKGLLEEIKQDFQSDRHGFQLQRVAGGYQFRTKTELRDFMARFYEKKPPRLTAATLEVLAVIAYKQPITRPEVEKIRGVDCSGVLKTLLERELIEMRGRSNLPGQPVIYGTTTKFLEWFQIPSLQDLPPLSEMEVLNRGNIEQGTENLLELLNRDGDLTTDNLQDMDDTLKEVGRVTLKEYPADVAAAEAAAAAAAGEAGGLDTNSAPVEASGEVVETPAKKKKRERKQAATAAMAEDARPSIPLEQELQRAPQEVSVEETRLLEETNEEGEGLSFEALESSSRAPQVSEEKHTS